jgi:hypothetical protein
MHILKTFSPAQSNYSLKSKNTIATPIRKAVGRGWTLAGGASESTKPGTDDQKPTARE